MTRTDKDARAATAAFTRPLLLTPGQDIRGYVGSLLGRAALFTVAATSVLAVLLIFGFIVYSSIPFFTSSGTDLPVKGQPVGQSLSNAGHRTVEFFTKTRWDPTAEPTSFGGLALIAGSLYVTVCSLLIAVPLGLLAALVLSDIVSFRARQIIKPIIELLAAIPSVAFGFFAIIVIAPYLQTHFGMTTGANVLNASFLLAVMAIPTIVSVSEDAISATGRELREASYALGATRAETLVKVVMPAAHNGIIAAVILGMMRAIGETMVVWMAAGNASQIPTPWWDISQSVRTMTATIAGDMAETADPSVHRASLFTVGLVLLAFTFVLNVVTEYFLHRVRRASEGNK